MIPSTRSLSAAPDVRTRAWRDDSDYRAMADVSNACAARDRLESFAAPDDYRWMARYLGGFDPEAQIVLVEAGGEPAGYAFARHTGRDAGGSHVVAIQLRVAPPWRREGIDAALLDRVEAIARALVTASAPGEREPLACETVVEDSEADLLALLGQRGYGAVKRGHRMTRELREPIPHRALPAGVEIRPATRENGLQVLRAFDEAMRDSRDYGGLPDGALAHMLEQQQGMLDGWVVAWRDEEVVAGVLGWVDEVENRAMGRRRGYVERIFTRRPWRRQGIAAALITEDLRRLRDRGMLEAALAVDADNPSGAVGLYEALGFRRINGYATLRRTIGPAG